jgi:hypothetical protein
MATVNSLKSALVTRVDQGRSTTLYSASRSLGESLMCPASAQELQNDIYGRPASQQTLSVNLDASCAQGTMYPSWRMIAVENQNRPYIPICAAGMRGGGDTQGVGRDLVPQDLYGFGQGGNFVRQYPTMNNAPFDFPPPKQPNYHWKLTIPTTFTHDASISSYYRG